MCASLFLVLCSSASVAGWGSGGCSVPVGPVAPLVLCQPPQVLPRTPPPESLQWWAHHGEKNVLYLYSGTRLVGKWDHAKTEYRPAVNGEWGETDGAPIPIPKEWQKEPTPSHAAAFGVERPKANGPERHILNGKEISKPDPNKIFEYSDGSALPDDGHKPHLSLFTHDKATKDKLLATLATDEVAKKVEPFRVQVYNLASEPERALAAPFKLDSDERFKASAVAGVVQSPEKDGRGKVIESFYFADAAETVAAALRKIDPDYSPNRRRPLNPLSSGKKSSWLAYLAAGFLGVSLLRRK